MIGAAEAIDGSDGSDELHGGGRTECLALVIAEDGAVGCEVIYHDANVGGGEEGRGEDDILESCLHIVGPGEGIRGQADKISLDGGLGYGISLDGGIRTIVERLRLQSKIGNKCQKNSDNCLHRVQNYSKIEENTKNYATLFLYINKNT